MKIKIIIYTCLSMLMLSCLNRTSNTKQPIINQIEIDEQTSHQLEGLEIYMRSTDFTGHITNIKINTQKLPDTAPDDSLIEELHTVNAGVIETFVGTPTNKIEFKIITEEGETIQFEKEIIISLCLSNNELSWAGSGSVFPATSLFIQKATKIKNSQPFNASPDFCK